MTILTSFKITKPLSPLTMELILFEVKTAFSLVPKCTFLFEETEQKNQIDTHDDSDRLVVLCRITLESKTWVGSLVEQKPTMFDNDDYCKVRNVRVKQGSREHTRWSKNTKELVSLLNLMVH